MTDTNGEQHPPTPVSGVDMSNLRRCARCQLTYVISKSTSSLKLTYCSFLCELGDLGFSMAGLETMEKAPKANNDDSAENHAEPVGID